MYTLSMDSNAHANMNKFMGFATIDNAKQRYLINFYTVNSYVGVPTQTEMYRAYVT